jgi:tetratricopeptide (TPR) repeat protein
MVYRPSMIPVLAFLLLAATPAEGQTGETPVPPQAQAAPEPAANPEASPATTPAESPAAKPLSAEAAPGEMTSEPPPLPEASAQPLPEATAPQVPAKPPAPRQQLKILAQDSRLEAYQQFRALYETARFDEALPYAKRVVELSEQDSARDHELPIAYNNLGATQYQLADYTGAEASYRQSLELLESTQGISSRRLVVPLAGLGAVYAAQDQHQVAAEHFDRALAVSRRADGLFNLQQLPLIAQAADSRYAMSDFVGAEKERMYALRIAEQNYGYGDERTLPPLLELGNFYEGLREFINARMMYMRARDVAMQKSGYNPPAVKALVGIARTHRMQYTMDPETLDSQQPARDEVTGEMIGKVYRESRVPPPAADRADRAGSPARNVGSAQGPHDGNADRARRLVPVHVAADDFGPVLRGGRRHLRGPGCGGPARGQSPEGAADGVLPTAGLGEPRAQYAVRAIRDPKDRLQLRRFGRRCARGDRGRVHDHGRSAAFPLAPRSVEVDLQPALL